MVSKSPNVLNCGSCTAHMTAVGQPNCLGQTFWLNVIFPLADLILHNVKYSLDSCIKTYASILTNG